MSRIICTLENVGKTINGLEFVSMAGIKGLISAEEVSEKHAEIFLKIPGYKVHDPDGEKRGKEKPETPAQRKAKLKALIDAENIQTDPPETPEQEQTPESAPDVQNSAESEVENGAEGNSVF